MRRRPRRWGGRATAVVLVVATALLLAAAAVAGYARAELTDDQAFSARVSSTLSDGGVRAVLATRAVDRLTRSVSADALAVRPALVATIERAAGGQRFRRVAAGIVAARHRQLFEGRGGVSLDVAASAGVLLAAIRRVSPSLADAIPAGLTATVVALRPRSVELSAARALGDAAAWWWPLLAAALVAAAATAAQAGSVLRALAHLGIAVGAGGLVLAAAVTGLGALAVAHGAHAAGLSRTTERDALGALWSALFADLRTAGLIAVLAGAVVAVAASAAERRRPDRAGSPALVAAASAGVLAIAAVAVALVLPGPAAAPEAAVAGDGGCNGSAALCDRPLNDVVFPSTHNSYAAADEPGWYFANQRYGIARQLRDGIRGLLIDVHYGVRDARTGRIRTNLAYEGSSRNKVVRELGEPAVRTADRLAGRVGLAPLDGPRGVYLCHTLCELGAEPIDDELDIVRRFLAAHPRDVVLLFVEPYVAVEEIERALRRTGLLDAAAPLRRDEPLPTLGQLGDRGTRLVVLAEEDGGTRPWYLPGFSFVQDTPFDARTAADLGCTRARGEPDSPMLLVNHWIATFPPSVSRNEAIGGAVLERRLDRCERERGRVPTLVAVDFYERSGVVGIARRLNARGPR